ncbi:MAG: biopolymer transporter ExbD [Casimicrobiaceae bacterium]|nr:biopolymer transporter ExbD [Casimicrobiaceae bacterium]
MRKRKLMNQINVVPFIDVILVLLIVFMIATPTFRVGEIELPSVGQSLTRAASDPIELIVGRDGSIDIGSGSGAQRALTHAQAVERVRTLQGQGNRAVVIAADRRVAYEQVVELLGALHAAGVKRVGLAARESD